jgi:hypothetical protein
MGRHAEGGSVKIALLTALVLISTTAIAAPPPQPKPGVVTQKKLRDAAMVLMEAMNTDNTLQKQMNQAIEAQIESMRDTPCADRIMGEMRTIISEALNYNAMKGDLANVYANNFTLDELEWMVNFYKTPLGTKMLTVQPLIYETMSNLSTARMKTAEPKIAALLAANLNDTRCQEQKR